MNKPDNFVDNPGLMPYGTNIGAPSIKPDNIENWKNSKIIKVNKEFLNRYESLKKQYANEYCNHSSQRW